MEKTDNGRKLGQLVTSGLPRQTAAERRQRSFAIAVEEFHCDASGRLFMEAFCAVAPPKRPHSSEGGSGEWVGPEVQNIRSAQTEADAESNESAA
jgi:hypothetical protein